MALKPFSLILCLPVAEHHVTNSCNLLEPGDSSKAWMWASFNIFHVSSARTLSFRPLLLAA
jgi:hypothetical protein